MSGAPWVRSLNVDASEARPILVPGGNKAIFVATARKLASKPSRKPEENGVTAGERKASSPVADRSSLASPLSALSAIGRQEMTLQSNMSLNASCSSDASTDSACSRTSIGTIGRPNLTSKRRQTAPKLRKIVAKVQKTDPGSSMVPPSVTEQGKRKCAWVTANTEPCYAAFHDEEWGVPVHYDREVFLDFDPVAISKLNEKKILSSGRTASSLLSQPKLRAIIENARQTLKIVDEFGSFDRYCWSFVNQKPIISRFRYPRQVPVKTPKAEVISKDLVRRGFRSVSPTVIYSFMQAAGLTNDHLISCYRFEECVSAASINTGQTNESKCRSCVSLERMSNSDKELTVARDLELSRVSELTISELVEV